MPFKLNINPITTEKPKPKPKSRDILFGSGLTKTIAIKQEKSAPKKEVFKLNLKPQKQEVALKAEVLPSAIMSKDIVLDNDQQSALNGMLPQRYACLIGSAGTGKTTTLKELVSLIEKSLSYTQNGKEKTPSIAFCSFMGKAVQQMKRALPKKYHINCTTIHALLGFKPEMVDYFDENGEIQTKMQFLPEFTEYNKLPYECIIIDEGGTIPTTLWHYLLNALLPECRVFILGDLNQLPPVAGHSILGFAMLKWPTFELKTLHRNAGTIAENAHRVINGMKPLTDNDTRKVTIKKIADGSTSAKKELLSIIKYLHEAGKFDPLQDAIIVPQNVDTLGQEHLNEVLVNQFNPKAKRVSIKAGLVVKVFAVGDKVMLLKNNPQKGLTNGMQGIITEIAPNNNFAGNHIANSKANSLLELNLDDFDSHIDSITNLSDNADNIDGKVKESERAASHIITVQFQDIKTPEVLSTVGELANITLSYVFTCHKAQGSEYRFVIVLCHSAARKLLSREWLYTAMTRAKNNLLILCNNRGLTHAVNTQRIKGNTIEEKAKMFISLTKTNKTDEKEVRLPDAVSIPQIKMNFKLGE